MPNDVQHNNQQVNWANLIQQEYNRRRPPLIAKTYIKKWPTASRPVALSCDDGNIYIVKSKQAGRQAVNDHIVGHLGEALNSPTGRPALVRVEQALIDAEREMHDLHGNGPFVKGIWHGSLQIVNVSDEREAFAHQDVPENRARYASLAILYGWAFTSQDHQFLFAKAEPRIVYSHDHGHFFPGGPDWSIAKLQEYASSAGLPDPIIVQSCRLTNAEIKEASIALARLDQSGIIAKAIAAPLEEWGIMMDERVAPSHYLSQRCRELLLSVSNLSP